MTFKKKAIPEASRRELALRYGATPGEISPASCHYCGTPGRINWRRLYSGKPGAWVSFSLEIDHVVPESAGGSSEAENLVLACRSCNRKKGARRGLVQGG